MITPVDKTQHNLSAWDIFKGFSRYYKPYIGILILDLICALILAAVDLAFPQFLRFFTNDFFTRSSQEILNALLPIAIALLLIYVLRTGAQFYITRWGHIMGASMETDMRRDLFGQFQRLSFSYYDKNKSGDMASRILTDLFDISELAHHGPENFLICGLKIIGSFVLLFMINVPLTSLLLLATIIMAIYSCWANYKKRNIFSENRQRMGQMNSQISDSLGGIRTVKSFGNEEVELEKFSDINKKFLGTKKQSYSFLANFNAANSMFVGVLYVITIVGGGFCVATSNLQVNELAIFALYIGIFISPIELLINFTETFQKGYAGFKRFMESMSEVPDVQDSPDAIDIPANCNFDVEYKDVCFSYITSNEKTQAIHNFNLSIKQGTKVALVGPSGGGKTTACSLLPRFYDVTFGSIYIGDHDIRKIKIESLRSSIGFVQQDIYLFDGTIADNISYAIGNAEFKDIVRAAKSANIHDFIMSLPDNYQTKVGERGTRLSGGQKQRIVIARLFLRNPQIIVLDEATSALDNESEAIIQRSIDALCKGKTCIIIAHRLSTIKSVDKIAVVNAGQVVDFGNHDELLERSEIYSKYYKLQFSS